MKYLDAHKKRAKVSKTIILHNNFRIVHCYKLIHLLEMTFLTKYLKVRRLRVDVVKQEELGVQAAQVSLDFFNFF